MRVSIMLYEYLDLNVVATQRIVVQAAAHEYDVHIYDKKAAFDLL